jgi:hypothetical protein
MYECPACHECTVRFARKWLSSQPFPVRCSTCKNLSYAPGSAGGTVMVVNTLLLTAAGFASFYWQSWLPVSIAASLAAFLWLYRLHRQPMVKLSLRQAEMARALEAASLLGVLFAMPFQ